MKIPQIKQIGKPVKLAMAACMVAALAACGGGGSSVSTASSTSTGGGGGVTQSPYLQFASDYISYSAQTNGAYLHSIQAGDVYTGFGGSMAYGFYSSPQTDMNRTGFYNLQAQAGATTPNTAGDYAYVAVLAPANTTFDISQANTLLITMGNTVTPDATHGHATVFTVDLNNAAGTTAATNDCTYNQTLSTVGPGTLSALGVRQYAIPLSSFTTCSVGSVAGLLSGGITTVAVKIVGNRNTSMVANEFNTIAVGSIGFAHWGASAGDIAALAL